MLLVNALVFGNLYEYRHTVWLYLQLLWRNWPRIYQIRQNKANNGHYAVQGHLLRLRHINI